MKTVLERSFEVEAPLEAAWEHLARVTEWPTWARHIRSVTLDPSGELTPETRGVLRLSNGIPTAFHMTELVPGEHWVWEGKFLWLRVRYDHLFAAAGEGRTRLTFVVALEGFARGSLGRLFTAVYARNLDRAIPRLVLEMGCLSGNPGG